ncbi:hypothetical protein DQ392_28310 [Streptomyces reniochalinae]|uniref:Amine oxidase domain-containing protein n=1 Tax=Streptomyces reniochalinae TaxID=2250578 RepID=A0A367EA78_9ACTN|nr:hypothetical protein DQ392_28310 [Streptomyces reniochalinae]
MTRPISAFESTTARSERVGLWFRDQLVPDVDDVQVSTVDRHPAGLRVKLASGEEIHAAAVIVASALTDSHTRPSLWPGSARTALPLRARSRTAPSTTI